jgi:hypothetical protein
MDTDVREDVPNIVLTIDDDDFVGTTKRTGEQMSIVRLGEGKNFLELKKLKDEPEFNLFQLHNVSKIEIA